MELKEVRFLDKNEASQYQDVLKEMGTPTGLNLYDLVADDGFIEMSTVFSGIEKLLKENKDLRKLVFSRCPLHGKFSGWQDMFINDKCIGYCRSRDDDEPINTCKECIIHEYYDDGSLY